MANASRIEQYVTGSGEVFIEPDDLDSILETIGTGGLADALHYLCTREIITFPYLKYSILDPSWLFDNLRVHIPTITCDKTNLKRQYRYTKQIGTIVVQPDHYMDMNRLTDVYAEGVRLKCRDESQDKTPLERWKDMDVLLYVAEHVQERFGFLTSYTFRELIHESNLIKECTTYKPTLAVTFAHMYHARRVLDLSCGWGDRLLGFLAAGVEVYDGCDPNPLLTKVYTNIVKAHLSEGQSVDIQCTRVEDYGVKEEYYDLFHSSPPFYTKERYHTTDGSEDFESWMSGFLTIYLQKAVKGVRIGGIVSIYIGDYGTTLIYDRMNDILGELGCEFVGIVAVQAHGSTRGMPVWVWRRRISF